MLKVVRRGRCARVGLVVLTIVASLAGAGAPASAANPNDPSPYCRVATVTQPAASAPGSDGAGRWYFETTSTGTLNCNGPIYSSRLVMILHYQTKADGVQVATGAYAGPAHVCYTGCSASVGYYRTGLWCEDVYTFADYGQLTGFWQQTSTSAQVQISQSGPTTHGSSYNPPGACS